MRRTFIPHLILTAMAFGATAAAQSSARAMESAPTPGADLARIEAALDRIDEHYIRDIPREALVDAAIRGMLESLDPYSTYMPAREYALFKQELASEFGGIGVFLRIDPATRLPGAGYLLRGGPAVGAGLRRGDVILEIDGESTEGLTIDEIRGRLIGAPGTKIRLLVRRPGSETPKPYELTRAMIETPSVRGARRLEDGRWGYMLDPLRKIGFIRITKMSDDTAGAVEQALKELTRDGMRALVLDLRDDAGGKFRVAKDVADMFLDKGAISIVTSPRETETHKAAAGVLTEVPVAMLISRRTASSGEILAAALSENGRVVTLGERTFGKGYIQQVYELGPEMGALKLTTASYSGPSGRNFDSHYARHLAEQNGTGAADAVRGGIAPDEGLEITLTKEETEALDADNMLLDGTAILVDSDLKNPPDRALEKAIEVLAKKTGDR